MTKIYSRNTKVHNQNKTYGSSFHEREHAFACQSTYGIQRHSSSHSKHTLQLNKKVIGVLAALPHLTFMRLHMFF